MNLLKKKTWIYLHVFSQHKLIKWWSRPLRTAELSANHKLHANLCTRRHQTPAWHLATWGSSWGGPLSPIRTVAWESSMPPGEFTIGSSRYLTKGLWPLCLRSFSPKGSQLWIRISYNSQVFLKDLRAIPLKCNHQEGEGLPPCVCKRITASQQTQPA